MRNKTTQGDAKDAIKQAQQEKIKRDLLKYIN